MIVFLYATGAGFGLWFHEFDAATANVNDGNAQARIGWLFVDVIVLGLVANRWKRVASGAVAVPLLAFFLLFISLSFAWSDFPGDTLRRSLGLSIAGLFGIYLATSLSAVEVIACLRRVLTVGMVASVLAAGVLPGAAIGDGGVWRGAYAQKNILGLMAPLLIITVLAEAQLLGRVTRSHVAQTGIATVCLLASQSATGALGLLAALGIVVLLRRGSGSRLGVVKPFTWCAAVIIGAATMSGALNPVADVMSLFGKSTDLTGRAEIWPVVISAIEERPLLGYGYGGFWHGWFGPSSSVWAAVPAIRPPHAHNSVLEAMLNFGLIGTVWFFAMVFRAYARTMRLYRLGERKLSFFGMAVMTMFIVQAATEITLLYHMSVNWMLVSYLIAASAIAWRAQRAIPARPNGDSPTTLQAVAVAK